MKLVIMGSGRFGASILIALQKTGAEVEGWRRGQPVPPGDVYWIAVKDEAIEEVSMLLPEDALVLHASGARGLEAIPKQQERGVLHLLMSFPGPTIGIPDLAGCYAAILGEGKAAQAAQYICGLLQLQPAFIQGDMRLYHAAAVLASSHLAAVFLTASNALSQLGVPDASAMLLPLALESLKRASTHGAGALTGPTIRGDTAVENGHLAVLPPDAARLYQATRRRVLELLSERSDGTAKNGAGR
jgi:predicted short-subunit dehydrogenase-like oxidoreductase (DUF2520 family)